TKPELEDFKRTIADYLSYEVGLILKNQTPPK
ncbi:restriction endonuclease, partial [Helicobacter pylori]